MAASDLQARDSEAWQEGIRLFNAGHWWEAHEAWDLATLVSVAMASTTDTTLGRLFPDARLAAAALSSEGHPLAGEVIAFDATGSLALRDFFDAATTLGYEGRPVVGLPSSRYADVPDREEPSYPGPFEKRW